MGHPAIAGRGPQRQVSLNGDAASRGPENMANFYEDTLELRENLEEARKT
ncbi:hypothetical protein SAMN05444920_120180 [Nonomuraea solani]|uniref:Uncharacterized protein n=1 Tax=Nonomuraea solani TaxID=1144553 RepID=A0A1H6EWV8_9ACTN|nr:hypothetical protein SAMN05444920_120180 [Nonomuraea solani]